MRSNICFSHNSINVRFSRRRFIEDTYDSLRNGKITVDMIPQMTVARINGKWFAWYGNRRLWVYRKLEADAVLDTITTQTTKCEIPRGKFTTQNGGYSTYVYVYICMFFVFLLWWGQDTITSTDAS